MKSPSSLTRLAISTVAALSISVFTVQAYAKTSAHEHGAARLTIASGEEGVEISFESPAANVFGFEHMPSSEDDHLVIDKAVDVLKKGDLLFAMNESAGCKLESVEVESAMVEDDDHDKHEDDDHGKHEDDDHKMHKEDDHDKHEDDHDKHEDDDHKKHKDDDHDKHEDDDHKKHKEDDHDKHEDDDHKKHKKEGHDKHEDDDHDDHKEDGHEKHDDHDKESSSTHNDVDVMWKFSCKDHEAIEQVEVKLLSAFPKGIEELDVDWISPSKSGHVELEEDGVVALK